MKNASSSFFRFMPLVLPLAALPVLSHAAPTAYDRGVKAFQAGHYTQALDAFNEAERAGNHSVQLHYNLGVTYYKLGDYAHARAIFSELAQHPDQAAIAHYNLGLIALKTGDKTTASAEFEATRARSKGNDPLRRLADAQLARLDGKADAAASVDGADGGKPSRVSGFMNVSVGHDDNVALAPETGVVSASQHDASLGALLLGGTVQVSGDRAKGWQVVGSYYGVSYPGLSQYDLDYVRLGPQYRVTAGNWRTTAGVSGAYLSLAGSRLETMSTFKAEETWRGWPHQDLSIEYRYDRISGGAGYDQLTGWRQAVKLEDAYKAGDFTFTAGYRLELNDRQDLSAPPQYISSSATRGRPYASAGWQFTERDQARLAYENERSVYNDTDLVLVGATLTRLDRVDTRNSATFTLTHRFARTWALSGEYRYLDNSSNRDSANYTSNRYELRLEHTFP